MKMHKTRYYSWKTGSMAKGCKLCVAGCKTVVFITGLCSKHCFYCPISEKKYGKDVIYINEWPTRKIGDLIKEIELCSSKGVGITGGDPLVKIDRTIDFIKRLKKRFGTKFHVHLYTPLNLVNEKNLERLYGSGLDEIRFHPDIVDNKLWGRIMLAGKYKWDVGVEIPAMPGKEKETKKLIDFLEGKVDFLNINELEYSDTNASYLKGHGFKTKDKLSYGIKGSEELAFRLLKYCSGKIKNVHYCTAKLKDKVQLAKRIKRRAGNIAKPFDIVSKDGILMRGAIYLKELRPSFSYHSILKKINTKKRNKIIKRLNKIKDQLKKDFKIKKNLIEIDKIKLRILTSVEIVNRIKDEINISFLENVDMDGGFLGDKGLFLAVVEEYPTYDQFELSVDFL
jgi:pyruvate formate-lyase activating enzyme-like uncharacterized protein